MCAESERVKSKVGEGEGVDKDDDKRDDIKGECEAVIDGIPDMANRKVANKEFKLFQSTL